MVGCACLVTVTSSQARHHETNHLHTEAYLPSTGTVYHPKISDLRLFGARYPESRDHVSNKARFSAACLTMGPVPSEVFQLPSRREIRVRHPDHAIRRAVSIALSHDISSVPLTPAKANLESSSLRGPRQYASRNRGCRSQRMDTRCIPKDGIQHSLGRSLGLQIIVGRRRLPDAAQLPTTQGSTKYYLHSMP